MTFSAAIPVNATFAAFGKDAIYDPDGVATIVRVIFYGESEAVDFSQQRITQAAITIEVKTADAVGWVGDDLIEIEGERRRLKIDRGMPAEYKDPDRLIRLVDTAPE